MSLNRPNKVASTPNLLSLAAVNRPGHGLGMDRQSRRHGMDCVGQHLVPTRKELLVEANVIHPQRHRGPRVKRVRQRHLGERRELAVVAGVEMRNAAMMILKPRLPQLPCRVTGLLLVDRLVREANAVQRRMVFQRRDGRGNESAEQFLTFASVQAVLQEALAMLSEMRPFLQRPLRENSEG